MKSILFPLAFVALFFAGADGAVAFPLSPLMADGMGVLAPEKREGRAALLLEGPPSLIDDREVIGALEEGTKEWRDAEWVSPFELNRAVREARLTADRLAAAPKGVARLLGLVSAQQMVVVKLTPQGHDLYADFALYDQTGKQVKLYKSLLRLAAVPVEGKSVIVAVDNRAQGSPVAVMKPVATSALEVEGLVAGMAPVDLADGAALFVGVENRIVRYRFDGDALIPVGETTLDDSVRIAGLFLRDGELYVNGLANGTLRSNVYAVATDGALTPTVDGAPWLFIDGGEALYGRQQLADRSLAPRVERLTRSGDRFTPSPFATLPEHLPVAGVAIDGADVVAIDERQSLVAHSTPDAPFEKIGDGFGGSSLALPLKSSDEAVSLFTFSPAPVTRDDRMFVVRNVRESGFIPSSGYASGSVALLERREGGWSVVAVSPVEKNPVTALALLADGGLFVARHHSSPFGGEGRSTLSRLTLSAP